MPVTSLDKATQEALVKMNANKTLSIFLVIMCIRFGLLELTAGPNPAKKFTLCAGMSCYEIVAMAGDGHVAAPSADQRSYQSLLIERGQNRLHRQREVAVGFIRTQSVHNFNYPEMDGACTTLGPLA